MVSKMRFTLIELAGMALRKTPIGKIRRALEKCEAAGIAVTANDLESQHLAGGDPLVLAEALVNAKQLGVSTTFHQMAAICLAGPDPMEVLLEASRDRVVKFDTFSPKRDDRIRGFTRDQREVSASITAVFKLSPGQVAWKFDFRHVHERLGAAASVFINTSPDLRTLGLKRAKHEAELKLLAIESLPELKSIAIEYR